VHGAAGQGFGRFGPGQAGPEIGIGGDAGIARPQRPAGIAPHGQGAAAGQGAFGTQDRQKGQPRLGAGDVAAGLPVDAQPAVAGHVGQDRAQLGLGHVLIGGGGAEGDAKEPQPRLGGGHRALDKLQLGAAGTGHLQQLDPVADRPQRVDKVVADARAEKGQKVGHRRPERVGMDNLNDFLEPGMLVRHPDRPDWGTGQVQSNIGGKVTVMFPDEGKVVIDGTRVALEPVLGG